MQTQPRICFVLDSSQSMSNVYNDIATKVENMRNRFKDSDVIIFSNNAVRVHSVSIPFLCGNTNIEAGFRLMCETVDTKDKERPVYIIFITDGEDTRKDTINERLCKLPKLDCPTRLFVVGVNDALPIRTIVGPLEMLYSTMEGRSYPLVISILCRKDIDVAFERLHKAVLDPTELPAPLDVLELSVDPEQLVHWAELAANIAIGKAIGVKGLPEEMVLGNYRKAQREIVKAKAQQDEEDLKSAIVYVDACIKSLRGLFKDHEHYGKRKSINKNVVNHIDHLTKIRMTLNETRKKAHVVGIARNLDADTLGSIMCITNQSKVAAVAHNKGINLAKWSDGIMAYIAGYEPNELDKATRLPDGYTVAESWLQLKTMPGPAILARIADPKDALAFLPLFATVYNGFTCEGSFWSGYLLSITAESAEPASDSDLDDEWYDSEDGVPTISSYKPEQWKPIVYLQPPAMRNGGEYWYNAMVTHCMLGDSDMCHHEAMFGMTAAIAAYHLRTKPLFIAREVLATLERNLETACPKSDHRLTYQYIRQVFVKGAAWMCLLPSIDAAKGTEEMRALSVGTDKNGDTTLDHLKCESLNKFVLALMLGVMHPKKYADLDDLSSLTPEALKDMYMRFLTAVFHKSNCPPDLYKVKISEESVQKISAHMDGIAAAVTPSLITTDAFKSRPVQIVREAMQRAIEEAKYEPEVEVTFCKQELPLVRCGEWTVVSSRRAFAVLAEMAGLKESCLDLSAEDYALIARNAKLSDNVERCSASMQHDSQYVQKLTKATIRSDMHRLAAEVVARTEKMYDAQFSLDHQEVAYITDADMESMVADGLISAEQKRALAEDVLPRCCLCPKCPHFMRPMKTNGLVKSHLAQQPIVMGMNRETTAMAEYIKACHYRPLTDYEAYWILSSRMESASKYGEDQIEARLKSFAEDSLLERKTYTSEPVTAPRVTLTDILNGTMLRPSRILLKKRQDLKDVEVSPAYGSNRAYWMEFNRKEIAKCENVHSLKNANAVKYHAAAAGLEPLSWLAREVGSLAEQKAKLAQLWPDGGIRMHPELRQTLVGLCKGL